jgi:hypothetical protein
MLTHTQHGWRVTATALLLGEGDDQLRAWAERHVRQDPDLRWILGNFVEADRPNDNGHIFPLEDLVTAQHTVVGKPLNMLHRTHYIVGAFAGAQLLTQEGAELTLADARLVGAADAHPYVEALAGMWHQRFPEEFFNIKRAHAEGSLFFSMEAIPSEVSCPTCETRVAYAGLEHASYCDHMQGQIGPKRLHQPVFGGGAIIIPPVKPGWSRADISTISKLAEAAEAEALYAGFADAAPHLDPVAWESLMLEVVKQAT